MTMERRRYSRAAPPPRGRARRRPFPGPAGLTGSGRRPAAPFRALRPIPDERDGMVRLHLPADFSYRSFHDTESPVTLDDGTVLPGRHDGMGAFRGPHGNVVLVRNHEVTNSPNTPAFGPGTPYDAQAGAGTTTVEVTPFGEVVGGYTSLNGTMYNCSGGVMPWGSWITCEETVNGPDVGPDFTGASNVSLQKPHGYIFEVPADGQSDRQPITQAGRFSHEAVSFDPVDGILYLTEDNFEFPSGFYRYVPATNPMRTGRLDNDGRLQMLAVKGRPNIHLEARQRDAGDLLRQVGRHREPEPDLPATRRANRLRPRTTQLWSRSATRAAPRGLHCSPASRGRSTTTTSSTSPRPRAAAPRGRLRRRQRQRVRPWQRPGMGVPLPLAEAAGLYQAPVDPAEANLRFDFPDNITTSPRGTLVVCEDSSSTTTSADCPVADSSGTSH